MRDLKVKIKSIEGNKATLEIFSKIPNTKREIANRELYVWRGDGTGEIETWLGEKTHKAFLCLHCGSVVYHDSADGNKYPLCSECRNTQTIFETYFQLDKNGNEYELKTEYLKKIDKVSEVD